MRYPKALAGRHLKIPFSTKVALLWSFSRSLSCFFYKGGAPLELFPIVILLFLQRWRSSGAFPDCHPAFSTKVALLWSLGESSLWLIFTKVSLLWSFYQSLSCFFYKGDAPPELDKGCHRALRHKAISRPCPIQKKNEYNNRQNWIGPAGRNLGGSNEYMRYQKALAGRHFKIPFSTKVAFLWSFYQSSSCFFYKGGAPLELG